MKTTYVLSLMTVLFAASTAVAVDCSAQFSSCIYVEASHNTANGTNVCIAQRTACMAQVHANGGVVSSDGVNVSYPRTPRNVAQEHRQERRDLRAFDKEEKANLRAQQEQVRNEAVGKIDSLLLKQQKQERKELRKELREDRIELRRAQRLDERGKLYPE